MINRVVNQRFEVLEKLGEGPLFASYKAREQSSDRTVVLKTLSTPRSSDGEFVAGLIEGLRASQVLRHTEIASCQELGDDQGMFYAVFEFARGIDLKERIRRVAPFSLSAAVDVACSVAEALHAAQAAGQSHGDLRPENIIVSSEGALKITDFGAARGIARSAAAQRDVLARSAPYHAPELSLTQPGTAAGDIYALGAILYEMLTGLPPYVGDSVDVIADHHAFSPVPSPRSVNPGVPRSIDSIVSRCLQKRPDERYHAPAELLADLRSVRDALRFGKPLSSSQLAPGAPAASAPAPAAAKSPIPPRPAPAPTVPIMAASNRLRARDERVSTVLKALIGFMLAAIILCVIGFVAIYKIDWGLPPAVSLPDLVGKQLSDVQEIAAKDHIRLILHGDYTDKPRNVVYRTDQEIGAQIRPGHYVNVWYSKGPTYVNVPDLSGMSLQDAEQALRDAGLMVGQVISQYSNTVPEDTVIRQTVSHRKRVLHDTPVDLVYSQGPQPDYSDTSADSSSMDSGGTDQNAQGQPGGDQTGTDETTNGQPGADQPGQSTGMDTGAQPGSPGGPAQSGPGAADASGQHEFDRDIDIAGTPGGKTTPTLVRIEYSDATGVSRVVLEEEHVDGDTVHVSFPYTGKFITMRIYYNGTKVFEKRFDPAAPRSLGRIGGGSH